MAAAVAAALKTIQSFNFVSTRRYYWYKSWFMPNTTAYQHVLHLFPHWNWDPAVNASVQVWAYSNANEIELFLNDASQVQTFSMPQRVCAAVLLWLDSISFSQGRVVNPPFAHSQWTVRYAPGAPSRCNTFINFCTH